MSTRFNLAKYNLVSTSQATFKDSICFAGRWLAQAVPNAQILDISIGSAAIESTTFRESRNPALSSWTAEMARGRLSLLSSCR